MLVVERQALSLNLRLESDGAVELVELEVTQLDLRPSELTANLFSEQEILAVHDLAGQVGEQGLAARADARVAQEEAEDAVGPTGVRRRSQFDGRGDVEVAGQTEVGERRDFKKSSYSGVFPPFSYSM